MNNITTPLTTITYFVDEIRTPFVINDIKRVAENFDSVYLFSVNTLDSKEALPENVVVFENYIDWKNFSPLKIVAANLFSILGIYLNECRALKKLLPLKKSIALLASNIHKANCIIKRLMAQGVPIAIERLKGEENNLPSSTFHLIPFTQSSFYSFWFYDCIYLAWMKKKGWIDKAVTRAHGGDLFEERSSLNGKLLFRNFQLKYLDSVFSISNEGKRYLQQKYPAFKTKIETSFLGSKDHGVFKDFDPKRPFVMVSCATVRDIKRIHKIAEALMYINFPITWIHLGSENLTAKNDPTIPVYLKNKEKLKANAHINYFPKGNMTNDEIMDFYKNNQVNLFVSLSEAEGVPVSMMEAISFGIPVLSTDVGGCGEIVTERTGILIPSQADVKEVAQTITKFKESVKNTVVFRKGVRQFWEEHFDAEKLKFDLNNDFQNKR